MHFHGPVPFPLFWRKCVNSGQAQQPLQVCTWLWDQPGNNRPGYVCFLLRWISVCCHAWAAEPNLKPVWFYLEDITCLPLHGFLFVLALPCHALYFPNAGLSHGKIQLSYRSDSSFLSTALILYCSQGAAEPCSLCLWS